MLERIAPCIHSPSAQRAWQGLLGLLTVAVLYLALSPAPPEAASTGWDKANHLLAFASLAWCARLGFGAGLERLTVMALALLGLGAGIEVLQAFEPTRSAEWADLLADAAGIGLGLCLAITVSRWTTDKAAPGKT